MTAILLPRIAERTFAADRCRLTLEVPADLFYFDGHFPDRPILPGIVQIHWAVLFAREAFPLTGRGTRALQVKFRNVIGPGAKLDLNLEFKREAARIRFDYSEAGRPCSTGQIGLGPA